MKIFSNNIISLERGRSVFGLEELIMGCTSTEIKQESSITKAQEAEWLKYSSYWSNPDNPDHHSHHH
ncbi:hypothetical protein AAZX31_01G129000 [Glycine max]